MNLPNAGQALVDQDKIIGYLLSPQHRFGVSKARFFAQFGFRVEEWTILRDALREHGRKNEASKVKETGFGSRYEVELFCPDGRRPRMRTVWQVDEGRIAPRLITPYRVKES